MYFNTKNYLKSTHNHTIKHAISLFLQLKKPSLPASNSKSKGHVIKERMEYGPIGLQFPRS
jgi:hypothetical protein